jgi:hypothetical protein
MTDLEDLVEAVFDIEDIVEEVADPEDLLEDALTSENPGRVVERYTDTDREMERE